MTELQQRVKQIALEAYAHQDIPFEKVVEKVQSHRDLSHSPIFQVLFVLQNMPGQQIVLPELTMTPETTGVDSAKFDLTMTLLEQQSSGQIIATLNYNTDLFVENSIVKMQQHFVRLLEGMVEQPDQNVSALQLLSQYEQQLIENFNHTQDDYDQSFCIHQLFEKQAQQRPDRIAVVCGGHRLSFKQLNEKSNQLAHYLMANNVKSGDIVGICLHRQVEMMVALWAILKTGAAYLPLDPNSPTTRLAFMLDDTNAELVITQQSLQDCLPKKSALVLIDNDWIQIAQQRSDNPVIQMNINSLVYIIYTSGSTGEPKGVCVAHRNLLHLSHALDQAIYKGGESLVVTFNAPLVFDASVKQWQRQVMGDTLVILPLEARTEPQQLRQILIKQKVQVLDGTPALIELLMTAGALDDSEMSLEHVLIGGESMSQDLWDRLAEMPSVNFYNVYGPTEATVDSSLTKITKNNIVNIGKALNNVQLYVLDRYKNNVPVGVIGELAIAGDGVTLGYHQRKQLTAEKFIDNPFEDSSKLSNKGEGVVRVGERLNSSLYLTGDLVRYLPDGRIQFVGRLDDQVKVRGYRIELGEIEAALHQNDKIKESIVLAREDNSNNQRLIAYVVLHEQETLNAEALREYLSQILPDYMLPSLIVFLDEIPLTINGKVDKKSLPDWQNDEGRTHEYVAPTTETEQILASIWSDILGIKPIGIHDDFFQLGGHSLLATQIVARIRRVFCVELPLRHLFERTTIAKIAELLDDPTLQLQQSTIEVVKRTGDIPLSFAQERLWFLDQLEKGSSRFYHLSGALNLQGNLSVEILKDALNQVVKRHESLRTVFVNKSGVPSQKVLDAEGWQLEVCDLIKTENAESVARQEMQLASQQSFDLSCDYLFRAILYQITEQQYCLFIDMHHIITDGWSLSVFTQEVVACYQAFSQQQPDPLPVLPIQYIDYAHWQRQWLQG
ncbi:MAG: amino acid adenylation domain-containing protein, partial [Methylococcales bacterium]|nr:amino acid adenylation domain-containing protein [Methylococcales bacterium]